MRSSICLEQGDYLGTCLRFDRPPLASTRSGGIQLRTLTAPAAPDGYANQSDRRMPAGLELPSNSLQRTRKTAARVSLFL